PRRAISTAWQSIETDARNSYPVQRKAVRRSAENQRAKRVKLYPMNALDSGSASATVAEPSSASVVEIASSPLAQRAQGSRSRARFVHLRLHSEYSIVDGMVRIDDAVA